jgi:hypothetical protein
MYDHHTPPGKDPQAWQLAIRRASFRRHFTTYVLVNILLWAIWFLSEGRTYGHGFPWPIWPTLGWGIGIASHYASAYLSTGPGAIEKEYDKITNSKTNN